MTVIVEGDIYSPLFQETLSSVPEVSLDLVDVRRLADDEIRFLFVVDDTDRPAFERALAADSTVDSFRHLGDQGDRWLYRVVLSEAGRQASTYLVAMELDVVLLSVRVTSGKMHVRARVPTRDALLAFKDACDEREIEFTADRIYEEVDEDTTESNDGRYGLTAPQREALLTALEMGYFDVPRRVQLNAMADRLGVSPQALSTRLRRGQSQLVRNTIAAGEPI